MSDLSERLEGCYTGAVHDIMKGMGLKHFVLPPTITRLFEGPKLAGQIFTVTGRPTPEASAHETLMAWTGFLSKAPGGKIVVIQPHDMRLSFMGELSAETLKLKGVKGCVIDGAARDVQFIIDIEFPVWCTHSTPNDIVGDWMPDGFDVPIRIGEVEIEPGDWLLADKDGVVILPGARAEEIIGETETIINTENKVRTAILAGEDPQEAYLKYQKF